MPTVETYVISQSGDRGVAYDPIKSLLTQLQKTVLGYDSLTSKISQLQKAGTPN